MREQTGWDLRFRKNVAETLAPTSGELAVLRDLLERTERAHARSAVS
jgi:hypothetical protein